MAEINKKANLKKFWQLTLGALLVLICGVGLILALTGNLFAKTDPMAQYKTERQCTFMSDTSIAYCTDGTKWNVTNVVTPPLP
jgi:hypothetical protein